MKKIWMISLVLCLLLQPMVGNAQTYCTIGELQESVPERWTQTYETKWRTVDIDVQPTVPSVGAIPVFQIKPTNVELDISSLGEGWVLEQYEDSFSVFRNGGGEQDTIHAEKKLGGITTTTNYYPPFDMSKVYVENNDLTLGNAINHLKSILTAIDEDPEDWQCERPSRILCNKTAKKTGEILLPGNYYISLEQKIQGIPLLGHVIDGIENAYENEIGYRGGLLYQIRSSEEMNFTWNKVKTTNILSGDVPLSDFSLIKATIESGIQEGHIRKIFDIDLGYVLYNDPGISKMSVNRETVTFYALPVWRVNCHYIESAKKEMRDYTGRDVPERSVIEYKPLFINAQTGKVIDRANNRKGCGDYKGFISWDDVGGKQ